MTSGTIMVGAANYVPVDVINGIGSVETSLVKSPRAHAAHTGVGIFAKKACLETISLRLWYFHCCTYQFVKHGSFVLFLGRFSSDRSLVTDYVFC